ncbi:hypothetical protein RF55_13706 [Lasius niger]|uniref:Uncharacterized protein n=1 Tax=Lasius niger TaxID=67767 RepID=A0A0J7K9Y0_LASNI|nr:hypothetical protein RF55_13706 [Lasius niger]
MSETIEFVREQLGKLSSAKLVEEAAKYKIKLTSKDPQKWVDAIIDHLSKHGPLTESQNEQTGETGRSTDTTRQTYSGNITYTKAGADPLSVSSTRASPTESEIPQMYTLLIQQLQRQREQMAQQMAHQMAQHQAMMQQLVTAFSVPRGVSPTEGHTHPWLQDNATGQEPLRQANQESIRQPGQEFLGQSGTESTIAVTGQAVKFLAIPTFGGLEEENITLWLNKLETIAVNHNLTSMVKLTAATSKLTKVARRWLDLSPGDINQSWDAFKTAITRRFKRRVLFNVVMQRVEGKRWNYAAESFQEYAMDKLAIMQPLKLNDDDSIHLLINGINNLSIKSAAATIHTDSIDHFLDEMYRLTTICDTSKKNAAAYTKNDKSKNIAQKSYKFKEGDSGSKTEQQKQDNFCVYCRNKGNLKEDCAKLRRKEQQRTSAKPSPSTVAVVTEQPTDSTPLVAQVTEQPVEAASLVARVEPTMRIVTDDTVLKVVKLNNLQCNLTALLDTAEDETKVRIDLFSQVASTELVESPVNNLNSLESLQTDFGTISKQKLISVIQEVENTEVTPLQEEYTIKIALKDESIYLFAPRKFAWTERMQDSTGPQKEWILATMRRPKTS